MSAPTPGDITQLLAFVAEGNDASRLRLIDLVYDELRRVAGGLLRNERADHTLEPTALVHEAWLRLFREAQPRWETRAHFFGSAAELMRRVLVDHARRRGAAKRGGGNGAVAVAVGMPETGRADDARDQTLFVHEAIDRLEVIEPRKALIVKLRFFAGLSIEEIAVVLDLSSITIKREWRYARAWLLAQLRPQ